jgi:hypothetical protein
MKTLIYSSALMLLLLPFTSCKKGDLVKTGTTDVTSSTPPPPPCDTTRANYELFNSTGADSYKIEFAAAGGQSHTFDFPAQGSRNIAIKPGVYKVTIYTNGNNTPHKLSLNGGAPVIAPVASFSTIDVTPCGARNLNATIN